MRVLVTGATGFVGRWLLAELRAADHEAVGTPSSAALDITDDDAVNAFVTSVRPAAIAHLAGMSYGPDARNDPERAMAVNVGGTRALVKAVSGLGGRVPVLVASSSEVYGNPRRADLPLRESAPLLTDQPYGRSKLAQEHAAVEIADGSDIPLVIARAFNHTGPGQRPEFVVPALAARIVAARQSGNPIIRAGNVDVRRDFGDVRDVARAYRLMIEALAAERLPGEHRVYNIASGQTVSIRDLIARLAVLVGFDVSVEVDPSLVRPNDPPEIQGDASRLRADVGWQPSIPFDVTLADVLGDILSTDHDRSP